MTQIIRYKDGNALSCSEYGDWNGYPILVQHGMIASISDYHLFDQLIESGRRVICIARPGYGESSPYRMENMAEWGEIVSVLVDALKLSQFDVLGVSSGAPYSYAIGYKLPDKVRNIFIFSGIPALYDEKVIEFWPYPVQKNASITEMEKVAREIFFSHVTKEDLLRKDIEDSMMNDCFGIAQDLRLRGMDWGFTLSDVREPVYMEHSRTDSGVPFITAEMTAKLLPNCQLEMRDGEHFSEGTLDRFIRNTILKR
ncbi:MAG TPA: alpha/beta fold hydrolase [Anaerolineales bacterium]|nr:alpha/beta fold hydrolase [Anaerolineales bacterium]